MLACDFTEQSTDPCDPLLVNPYPLNPDGLGVNIEQQFQQMQTAAAREQACMRNMLDCPIGTISLTLQDSTFGGGTAMCMPMTCPTDPTVLNAKDPGPFQGQGTIFGCTFGTPIPPPWPTAVVTTKRGRSEAEACELAKWEANRLCGNAACPSSCERLIGDENCECRDLSIPNKDGVATCTKGTQSACIECTATGVMCMIPQPDPPFKELDPLIDPILNPPPVQGPTWPNPPPPCSEDPTSSMCS